MVFKTFYQQSDWKAVRDNKKKKKKESQVQKSCISASPTFAGPCDKRLTAKGKGRVFEFSRETWITCKTAM